MEFDFTTRRFVIDEESRRLEFFYIPIKSLVVGIKEDGVKVVDVKMADLRRVVDYSYLAKAETLKLFDDWFKEFNTKRFYDLQNQQNLQVDASFVKLTDDLLCVLNADIGGIRTELSDKTKSAIILW